MKPKLRESSNMHITRLGSVFRKFVHREFVGSSPIYSLQKKYIYIISPVHEFPALNTTTSASSIILYATQESCWENPLSSTFACAPNPSSSCALPDSDRR